MGVSAEAVSPRLHGLEAKEEVLDNPLAQLLMLRSQAATLPPPPSSTLGRGALMPALANLQSLSFSRSMTGSATGSAKGPIGSSCAESPQQR